MTEEFKNWREYVGRFSVEIELANGRDLTLVQAGYLSPDQVRRTRITGVVDTGAVRLVLPRSAVSALGLQPTGQITAKFADGRREPRETVGDVRLEYAGRSGVFTAMIEPGRSDALIGAMVLEELDLLPDCTNGVLTPRDPNSVIAEVE